MFVSLICGCVTQYKASTLTEQNLPNLQPSVKWLQQVLDQLLSVQMLFCHIEFIILDLQRVWLHVWAILDYMQIYKSHINGLAPPDKGVANMIGTFMTSICVAQDMFFTGLPFWLIRLSDTFAKDKIFQIHPILHPKEHIILDPHWFVYPVIFQGPAASLEKYHSIKVFAHNFLCSQDPFAISATPSSISPLPGPSQISTSSRPAVASSSITWPSSGQDSRWYDWRLYRHGYCNFCLLFQHK